MKQVVQEHSYVLRPEERRTRWDQLLAEHARLNSPTRSKSSSSHGGSRKTRGELSGRRTTTPATYLTKPQRRVRCSNIVALVEGARPVSLK